MSICLPMLIPLFMNFMSRDCLSQMQSPCNRSNAWDTFTFWCGASTGDRGQSGLWASVGWWVKSSSQSYSVCLNIITHIGLMVAQVQVIFHLPQEYGTFTHLLAYIEWFTAFSTPTANLGMYQISHSFCSHHRQASIIPTTQIKCSVNLILKFEKQMDVSWSVDDVLERCKYFYVNCYLQHLDFLIFYFLMGI